MIFTYIFYILDYGLLKDKDYIKYFLLSLYSVYNIALMGKHSSVSIDKLFA